MRKLSCILLFMLSAFALKAQDPRDSLIGCYYCAIAEYRNGNFYANHSSDTVCIEKNDTLSICVNGLTTHLVRPTALQYHQIRTGCAISDSTFHTGGAGYMVKSDSMYYNAAGASYWQMKFRCSRIYGISLKEIGELNNLLSLSPQPAVNELYVQSFQLKFMLEDVPLIYAINGKQVNVPIQFINATTYKIDVRSLSSGMYVVVIKTNEGVVRKKIVIER